MTNKYVGKTRKTTAEAEAKRMVTRYTAVVKKVATMKKQGLTNPEKESIL